MKMLRYGFVFVLCGFALVIAQETAPPVETLPSHVDRQPSRIYYGGQLGVNFGDYFQLGVVPFVSVGVSAGF